MPYGIDVRSNRGSSMIDGQNSILCLTDRSVIKSPDSSSTYLDNNYFPFKIPGFTKFTDKIDPYFAFFVGTGITGIELGTFQSDTEQYYMPTVVGLNNGSNMGNREFKFLNLSDRIPKGTGGYGLSVFNQSGQNIYRFDDKVLKINSSIICNDSQTIVIPNNIWVCPIYVNDTSSQSLIGRPKLQRQGTTTNWFVSRDNGPQSGQFSCILLTFYI